VKTLIASSFVLLLAATPAFAAEGLIYASDETQNSQEGGTAIELNDFTGGVATTDAHDGGGAMVIQMLMPNTASSVTATPGPFVSRAAVSGGSH
jgi:ABC-type nitrate/sulfonate/bicarbonate transport system substrate-binding protein